MSFVNLYKPPEPQPPLDLIEQYGPDPYDVNFAFPLHLETLESNRVRRLTPFIPSLHGQLYWDNVSSSYQELFRYYPIIHNSLAEFLAYIEKYYRSNPEFILLAIIDKTRPDLAHPELGGGSMAGVIALLRTSSAKLCTEIGYVLVFPAFQRTHVATHATGVLLQYCLRLPSESPPGLGLRRIQWISHPKNEASLRLARRMGFKGEGTLRWTWILPEEIADGDAPRGSDPCAPCRGLHSVVLAVCWDDWEQGAK
ncbi:hypothetical protein WOLCODRAFT_16468 [Wolfiporia cocos MD-104 SS10]|uniref:N-acetyltransferase domain-containing protein n=1 Tax=Wolfiporia cocos (strain MD-104) TaxID=742152 RepID=A0A2H3JUG0_WOLCO|nr:hypothetical protein WOLCODRAFT_16468 [Wolfiporia cocos MD-104 SS10]